MKLYILATGPSVNNITNKEWQFLKNQKTLAISWFVKHPFFEPTYHYFHEYSQKSEMVKYIEKWKNTIFLTTKDHLLPKNAVDEKRYIYIKHTPFKEAFCGKPWLINQPKPPCDFEKVWAQSFDEKLFGFRGTLTAALNAGYILGYREFYLCGVDLWDNSHFYNSEEPSGFNKILQEKGINIDKHSTAVSIDGIRTIVDCLQWLNRYLRIYITNKDSLLVKEKAMEFKSIIC